MSCSPGVVLPEPGVDSPRVWSRFAQSMKSFCLRVENKSFSIRNHNHKNQVKFKIFSDQWMDGWLSCNKARCQTNPVDQCVKQSLWLVDESRWRLKSDDSSIDPSTGTKHRESDYSLLKESSLTEIWGIIYIRQIDSHSGRNDFILRAKRLQIPGESTLGPGDSGRTGHWAKRPASSCFMHFWQSSEHTWSDTKRRNTRQTCIVLQITFNNINWWESVHLGIILWRLWYTKQQVALIGLCEKPS